jgi:hypothetical protein
MTGLMLMLVMAAAMALFREPLGRGLTKAVDAFDWRWAILVALLVLGVWLIVHNPHANTGVFLTGDSIAALFDTVTYGDLLIGVTVAILNRQTRQVLGRVADFARLAGLLLMRQAGRVRAVRTRAKPRRRTPDREEPEPGLFGGVFLPA